MARPKRNSKPTFEPVTFVRCELSSEERADVSRFIKASADDLDTLVVEILQANYKIGFSFSEHNDSFICSVTGRPEDCTNASKCFTSHAKDYSTALWVALYKYHVIWKGGVWEEDTVDLDFG